MSETDRPQLPAKLYAEVVVRSASGQSLLDSADRVTSENVSQFYASVDRLQASAQQLRQAGFEVLDIGRISITIAATPEVYERSFQTTLEAVERPVIKELGRIDTATFMNAVDRKPFGEIDVSGTAWHGLLDGIAINEPIYYFQAETPSTVPPTTPAEYLSVPDGVIRGLNAAAAHQQGITGKGVKVAMVDSGWYPHPFFSQYNYRVRVCLAPNSIDPERDDIGHGTGESANLLAIAPDVALTMVKADVELEGKLANVNSISALRTAIALQPDIISCSWGSDERKRELSPYNRVLAATVADAVRQGIIVIFSAGNGHCCFPAQHPEVIAAGGVYLHLSGSLRGTLEASNYASSFISPIYPGRQVPDVCGLVGKLPCGSYIMLPVQPGCKIDRGLALSRDGTEEGDGWAAFSGTSAAAPQLAGICALMKQVDPKLSPAEAKRILQHTARDVVEGFSNPASSGASARAGPDLATGYGLADAYAAIQSVNSTKRLQPRSHLSSVLSSNCSSFSKKQFQNKIQIYSTPKGCKIMNKDFQNLKHNLEKIKWEIEEILEKYDILDLELLISESNFISRSLKSKTVRSLRKSLNPCFPLTEKTVTKSHVLAAKSLLQLKTYQETALEILTEVITNSKYSALSDSQELQELALEALGHLEVDDITCPETKTYDNCTTTEGIKVCTPS